MSENYQLLNSELKAKPDLGASLVLNNYLNQYMQVTQKATIARQLIRVVLIAG